MAQSICQRHQGQRKKLVLRDVDIGPVIGRIEPQRVINHVNHIWLAQERQSDLPYRQPGHIVDQLSFCLLVDLKPGFQGMPGMHSSETTYW